MADKHPNAPRGHTVGTGWPSWCYGPNGEAAIFQTQADVPEGWADHPSKAFVPPPPGITVDDHVVTEPATPDCDPRVAAPRRPLTLKRTPAS